jgi:hypothetical protein
LVGDQLEQHQLQLARVEDAPPAAAASFAMFAVAAEAVATAMAEGASVRAVVVGELKGVRLVRSGMSGPPAEASVMVAIVAVAMAPALVVAVGGMGESHIFQSLCFDMSKIYLDVASIQEPLTKIFRCLHYS